MVIKIFDIETSNLNADFGIVLCACVKTYGKPGVTTFRADQYKTWKTGKSDDSPLVKDLVKNLDDADILIAHNGQYFDKAFLNAKCVKYNIKPVLRWKKFIDPVLLARRHMKVGRNSLASLIAFLETTVSKSPITPGHWNRAALDSDRKALGAIVRHCDRDVRSLEEVYDKVRGLVEKINSGGSAY